MKNALIAIDFINDITHADGKIPSAAAQVAERHVIAKANQALRYARAHNWLVILVKVGFEPNYHAQPKNSPIFGKAQQLGALNLATAGCAFHPELQVEASDLVIEKPRVSPFYGTALDVVLRTNHIEHLYVCGVSTTWAIQAVTRDAHDRDYRVSILEDACAASDLAEHEAALKPMARIASIIKVEQLETALP
jgi:ureidoacrylate peracid hydrolase